MGGSVGASSGVNSLSYSQLISQLNEIGNSDVICLKDGQLGVWKAEGVGVNTPNTSEVKNAVFEAIKGKLGAGSSGVENAKKLLLGHVGGENGNGMTGSELREILAQIKDLNAQQVEKKPEFVLPEVGMAISMSRDELEKNIKGWLEAGYRVNVKTVNKGTYRLEGGVKDQPHAYNAKFTSLDGRTRDAACTFTLPEKSSFTVSQASVAKLGEKPDVEIRESLSVGVQTKESNTCFLWSFFNSFSQVKNTKDYEKNEQVFRQNDPNKLMVFTDKGLKVIDTDGLKKKVERSENGPVFLKKLENLKHGFEKNLVLYCYANNINGYQEKFDKTGAFPIGEESDTASLFGLKLNQQMGLNFKKNKTNSNKKENALKTIENCLKENNMVTLNLNGAHFVAVKSVDVKEGTVTYIDSSGGSEETKSLEKLAAAYNVHGGNPVLTFSSFRPQEGDEFEKNFNDVLDFVQELKANDNGRKTPVSPKSQLMKDLLTKCPNNKIEKCESKEGDTLSQISSFSAHIKFIKENKDKVLEKFKEDSMKVTASISLCAIESDGLVQFLSAIKSYLALFENVDSNMKLYSK